MIKKIVCIMMFIGIILSISSVGANVVPDNDLVVEYGDIVKLDHLIYDKDMSGVIEGDYNVFMNMTLPLDNWQLGMIGMAVGENKTYLGEEFGGCIHYIEILGILRFISPVSDEPAVLINPDIDTFIDGVGDFAIENWFELLISGFVLSFLGYKIFAK